MSAAERLMRYCRIDTQSDPDSGTHPSARKEFDLADMLVKELKELGLTDAAVDEHCYIYAHLPSNLKHPAKTVGFIAHMDTAPDFSGSGVNPRLIEAYDGGDIVLGNGRITRISDFPAMKQLSGKTLIVTDGNTLLGADDKAGITSIMEVLAYYRAHPEAPHGPVSIAFTPDEEIGEGALFFDVKKMNADFAYTMDGGTVAELSDETFNASSASVTVKGVAIHPGSAKSRMKNAVLIAAEFVSLLPAALTPAHTEGKEGFIHVEKLEGDIAHAELQLILRDHDAEKLRGYENLVKHAAEFLNLQYGEGTVSVNVEAGYRNMQEVLRNYPQVSALAMRAIREIGYEPQNIPVRGGTDGSAISFMGLPCPNLGNGGGNFHGPHEYCVVEELEDAVKLIRRIIELTAEEDL